jgi:hypothetical protein
MLRRVRNITAVPHFVRCVNEPRAFSDLMSVIMMMMRRRRRRKM